jgi:hypothetical protein
MPMQELTRPGMTAALLMCLATTAVAAQTPRFEVGDPIRNREAPMTGRLVLVVAKRDNPEPRYAISPSGPAIFAVDLEQLPAGKPPSSTDRRWDFPGRCPSFQPETISSRW